MAFIRRPQAEELIGCLYIGSSVQFSGSDYKTATGGDYVLLWLHKFGLLGFVKLPERPCADGNASNESTRVDAVTVKVGRLHHVPLVPSTLRRRPHALRTLCRFSAQLGRDQYLRLTAWRTIRRRS